MAGYRRKMLIPAAVLLSALALGMGGCGEKTIKSSEFINVEFQGLNEEGTISVEFDKEKLMSTIQEKKKLTERELETLEGLLKEAEKDYSISKKSDISNGDTIELTGGFEKGYLKDYGLLIDNDTLKVTAEGLVEKSEVNINDYIGTFFDGFEGDGHAQIELDYQAVRGLVSEKMKEIDPSVDPESADMSDLWNCLNTVKIGQTRFEGLSNGDEINTPITMENTNLASCGITFVTGDYTDTVEGLAPTETIALSDYLKIDFTGYEGFGKASCDLDTEKLAANLQQMFETDGRSLYGKPGEADDYEVQAAQGADRIRSMWKSRFDSELDVFENLYNGDPVKLVSTYSIEGDCYISDIGIYLENGETEAAVDGLKTSRDFSVNDYVNISYEGYEGIGRGKVEIDTEGMREALAAFIREQDETVSEDTAKNAAWYVPNYVSVDVSSLTELSGGQEVTIPVTVSQEAIPDYGVILKAGNIVDTVEGLTAPEEIDLADAVTISFEGTCPNLTVVRTVNYDLPYIYRTSLSDIYEREDFNGENGDTYKLKIEYDAAKLLEIGYVVVNDTAEAVVSGLPTFSFAIGGAEDEQIASYAKTGLNMAEAAIWGNSRQIADNVLAETPGWIQWDQIRTAYEKETLASSINEDSSQNELFLTYHSVIPVRGTDRSASVKDAYYVTWVRDLTKDADGNLTTENEWNTSMYFSREDAENAIAEEVSYRLGDAAVIDEQARDTEEELFVDFAEEIPVSGEAYTPEEIETGAITPEAEAASIAGPVILNGHSYYLFDTVDDGIFNWTRAKKFCDEAGGHLATITSKKEQCAVNYLLNNSEHQFRYYWIGASDKNYENSFQWITGEDFSEWIHWGDGSPNNNTNNLDGKQEYLGLEEYYGDWVFNDLENSLDAVGFVLEIEPAGTEPVVEIVVPELTLTPRPEAEPEKTEEAEETEETAAEEAAVESEETAEEAAAEIEEAAKTTEETAEAAEETAEVKEAAEETAEAGEEAKETSEATEAEETEEAKETEEETAEAEEAAEKTEEAKEDKEDKEDTEEAKEDKEETAEIEENKEETSESAGETAAETEVTEESCTAEAPDETVAAEETSEEEPAEPQELAWTDLADLIPSWNLNTEFRDSVQDPYGNVYFQSLAMNTDSHSVVKYSLDQKYTSLTGVISTWNQAGSDARMHLYIWGDDQLLYRLTGYQKMDAPVPFKIDLTGISEITIETENQGSRDNGWLFLNNASVSAPKVEGKPAEETAYTAVLDDLPVLYSYAAESQKNSPVQYDIYGNAAKDGFRIDADAKGRLMTALDGKYDTFTGYVSAAAYSENQDTAFTLTIYGDGEKLWECSDAKIRDGRQSVDLAVSGVKVLDFQVEAMPEETWDQSILISDTLLTGSAPAVEKEDIFAVEETALRLGYENIAAESVVSGNYRYYRIDEPMTFLKAKETAGMAGGYMAMPKTPEENAAIRYLVDRGLYESYWLGGSMQGITWTWADGEAFGDYRNWSSGQPDNYNLVENLLCMYRDGTWNDWDSEEMTGFILQMPAVRTAIPENAVNLTTALELKDIRNAEVRETVLEGIYDAGSVRMDARETGFFTAELNGDYSELIGRYLVTDNTSVNTRIRLAIFGDGNLIYDETADEAEGSGLRRGDRGSFCIDVSGIKDVTLTASGFNSNEAAEVYLSDLLLVPAEEPSKNAVTHLRELEPVDQSNTWTVDSTSYDIYNNLYDRLLGFAAGSDAYVLYNLGGKYSSFTCTIIPDVRASLEAEMKISILLDNEEVFSCENINRLTEAFSADLDVTGKKTLKIVTACADETDGEKNLYISGDILK